jgi:uncharacterized membrane protein
MLQIFGYLLCAYLVIKGFEIFINARVSDPDQKTNGQFLATLTLIACIALAAGFLFWFTMQANQLQSLPGLLNR